MTTEKQATFIRKLAAEKARPASGFPWGVDGDLDAYLDSISTSVASGVISGLLALPRAASSTPAASAVVAGVYQHASTGELLRVYLGQQSGVMLAKAIEIGGWGVEYRYAGSAAKAMAGDGWNRLTLAEVGTLGKAFDHCVLCGRRLDDPESVDRGVGPVCAQKY